METWSLILLVAIDTIEMKKKKQKKQKALAMNIVKNNYTIKWETEGRMIVFKSTL